MVGAFLASLLHPAVAFADDAVTNTLEQELIGPAQWLEHIFETLTNNTALSLFLTAVVALVFTAVLAHLVTKLVNILMEKEVLHIANTSLMVNILRVVIWAIGVAVVLSTCFGIDVTAWITALGIGGIALSLGLQDTISNLIGGLQVSVLGIVKPGDYVDVGGKCGIVEDVSWRHTTVRDFSGVTYVIPNKVMNTSTVSILPPSRKVKVTVSFSENPGKDLEELKRNMLIAVKNEVSKVAAVDKDPVFRFSTITEFSFQGTVIIWVNTLPTFDIFEVQDAIVRACAPYCRAKEMSKELVARPRTRGALKKEEGYEELVSAEASMADELMAEEDFMWKGILPTKAAAEAAAKADPAAEAAAAECAAADADAEGVAAQAAQPAAR